MVDLMPEKEFNLVLSHVLADNPEWDKVAGDAARDAETAIKRAAAPHSKSRDYVRSIKVSRGKLDYHVKVTDKDAAHIEFGHAIAGEPSGAREYRRGSAWVRGTHIVRNAAKALKSKGYRVSIGKNHD